MYMGVILKSFNFTIDDNSIPHVYGGDPTKFESINTKFEYSPCIWG